MAANAKLGCSGCLIEAIERRDESAVRKLLSAENAYFPDTYWVPRCSISKVKRSHLNTGRFPVVASKLEGRSNVQCTHSLLEETLLPGLPPNIALSVVLTAMLHTRKDFNAFKILAESQKFDLSEPLVFHIYENYTKEGGESVWHVVAIDPTGLALLQDTGNDFEDESSFLLLKTLHCNSLLNPEATNCRLMNWGGYDSTDLISWESCRATDALSFLFGCSKHLLFFGNRSPDALDTVWMLRALCEMGLSLSPTTRYGYTARNTVNMDTGTSISMNVCGSTLVSVLLQLSTSAPLDYCIEFGLNEWIRSGWICIQRSEDFKFTYYSYFYDAIHSGDEALSQSACRIARQLLALGLFRQPEPEADRSPNQLCECFVDADSSSLTTLASRECPRLFQLKNEFLRHPLSLQQLSRIEIRSAVGMNDFEQRVKSLNLPSLLLNYVWRANENLEIKSNV